MSRVIKFRTWIISDDCFLNGKNVFMNLDGNIVQESDEDGLIIEVDSSDLIIEQFTGLKDINVLDLYENDLIKNEQYGIIYQIVWDNEYCAWWIVSTCGTVKHPLRIMLDYCFKIGSIHENPELLK